jgi:ribonuclease E
MLVQVVKEERGNKGAALTTYLSLAGRYCVLMPNTARGGGISRKITNAPDRKKLKDIAGELKVPQGAGLIIRTAGSQRTKPEIKRDYEYLMRLWEQIRELTLKSIAPAPIYEEGDLIKRTIRDLYSREIDEVLVEGERGYRTAKDFMRMIMPSHAKQVKHYHRPMPLFARYQVEGYLGHVQPGRAAEIGRLYRHRRDRGAGGDRRELRAGRRRKARSRRRRSRPTWRPRTRSPGSCGCATWPV